jgi:hypothetical protein
MADEPALKCGRCGKDFGSEQCCYTIEKKSVRVKVGQETWDLDSEDILELRDALRFALNEMGKESPLVLEIASHLTSSIEG